MLLCWILTPRHLVATMALYCLKIQQTQVKPWLNSLDLCKSLLCLMKPTPQTCFTTSRERNPKTRPPTVAARTTTRGQRLLELSHAPPQILDSQPRSQSHALPRRPCHPPIYLAWESGGHMTLHAPPRATWVSGFSSTRWWTLHTPTTCRYCCWCHLTSSLHVSSHASTSTSAPRHRMTLAALLLDPRPDPKTRNRPRPVSVDFDPRPVDFDFLR